MDVGAGVQSEDDGSVQSLGQWKAAGHDVHSLTSAPANLFAGYSVSDFHLLASSSAIHAGVASLAGYPAPAFDCSWAARPFGAGWDVGAYQYGSPAGTAIPQSITRVTSAANGSLTIYAVGIPLCAHQVQAKTALQSPAQWQTIGTATAGPTGSWQFTDTNQGKLPARFYRAMFP
jgi:hypothetical protein